MKLLRKMVDTLINVVKTGARTRMDVTREYYERDR